MCYGGGHRRFLCSHFSKYGNRLNKFELERLHWYGPAKLEFHGIGAHVIVVSTDVEKDLISAEMYTKDAELMLSAQIHQEDIWTVGRIPPTIDGRIVVAICPYQGSDS